MIRTRFTEMFGIEHPIMSAPLGLAHSDGALAAAVSNGGGLGTFGAMNAARDPEWARQQIELTRARTSRPFGVGFISHFIEHFPDIFDAVIDEQPPVVALSFGHPEPWLSRAKAAGAKVICQVQTYELARAAVDSGADALAAQGNEAGGHTGVMGMLPFLSGLREMYPDIALLAAGGVGDARTLAAVLAAEADGAWIGTAFLATREAPVSDAYKRLIVESDGGDTVFTKIPDIVFGLQWPESIAVRLRRNKFIDRWLGHEDDLGEQQPTIFPEALDAMQRTDPDEAMLLYGPTAGLVHEQLSAADVLRNLSEGAERVLKDRLSQLFGP
jgi:nitronate monooxygenase